MEERWGEGIFVGKRGRSDENIIITEDGQKAVKARSIKYMTKEESWCSEDIEKILATPWKMWVDEMGEPRKVVFYRREDDERENPENLIAAPVPRDVYIMPNDSKLKETGSNQSENVVKQEVSKLAQVS